MNTKINIEQTKHEFEKSFQAGAFYNKQTQDDSHLEAILHFLPVQPEMKILDLGTGTGYLAFELARAYPQVEITGLDIVEKALESNRKRAKTEGLVNLHFVSYAGVELPFKDSSFDLVVTRYALHHFPVIEETFREISRVLKSDGKLFLSDPAPNENDTERFVDEFMQVKPDGHMKFYTKEEWMQLGDSMGLKFTNGFETSIRFPRKRDTALVYEDMISRHKEAVIQSYAVEFLGDEVWITEKVNNLLFEKTGELTKQIGGDLKKVSVHAIVERIKKMERYLDEVSETWNHCPKEVSKDADIQKKVQELTQYLDGGQWLQDYEADERGELPADLKCGVLSQDALYNLLCEIEEVRRNGKSITVKEVLEKGDNHE